MQKIHKQKTGFHFGLHRLQVVSEVGQVVYLGRTYKVVMVKTETGQNYLAIRLYNEKGKFIKQFLLEPEIASQVGQLLIKLVGSSPKETLPCNGSSALPNRYSIGKCVSYLYFNLNFVATIFSTVRS